MARGLKFQIYIVEGYSENEGADQLRGYREADLCLCFSIRKKRVISQRGSLNSTKLKTAEMKHVQILEELVFPVLLMSDGLKATWKDVSWMTYAWAYEDMTCAVNEWNMVYQSQITYKPTSRQDMHLHKLEFPKWCGFHQCRINLITYFFLLDYIGIHCLHGNQPIFQSTCETL